MDCLGAGVEIVVKRQAEVQWFGQTARGRRIGARPLPLPLPLPIPLLPLAEGGHGESVRSARGVGKVGKGKGTEVGR